MSEFGPLEERDEDAFVPSAEPSSAAGGRESESTNLCRAAALAVMLRDNTGELGEPITAALRELGFADEAISTLGFGERFDAALMGDWFRPDGPEISEAEQRLANWRALNERADRFAAMKFLIGVLGSGSERESAAAAAALLRVVVDVDQAAGWAVADLLTEVDPRLRLGPDGWSPEYWRAVFSTNIPRERTTVEQRLTALRFLVTLRLRFARQSSDQVTRSLALALRLNSPPLTGSAPAGNRVPTPPGALGARVSNTPVGLPVGWPGSGENLVCQLMRTLRVCSR